MILAMALLIVPGANVQAQGGGQGGENGKTQLPVADDHGNPALTPNLDAGPWKLKVGRKPEAPPKIKYAIQIREYKYKPYTDQKGGLYDLATEAKWIYENNLYILAIGDYDSYEEAEERFRKLLMYGYRDMMIIAFSEDDRHMVTIVDRNKRL